MRRSRTELTAVAGLVGSCLSLLLLAAPAHGLSLAGALLLAAVPPGAALMCWVDAGEGFAQAGLTLAVSLTALALIAAVMLWAHAWHPGVLPVLAGASVLSCGLRLRRRGERA